jgi:hypothetical protein
MQRQRLLAGLVAGSLLASVAATSVAAADPPFTVVADGLHNPRGLAFGPGGVLYVAEAGLAGGNEHDGIQPGYGMNGSIAAIRGAGTSTPTVRTVISGLPSLGETENGDVSVVGVDGLSVRGNGNILGIIALSREGTGIPNPLLGELIKVTPSGSMKRIANVGSFNWAWSTRHADLSPRDFPDSNPYGVLAAPGRTYVVDAGTNTLNVVLRNRRIKTLAFFPDNALADSTPTCVTKGPDGALYVGTLALQDSFAGGPSAKVYRVDLSQTDPNSMSTILGVATVWADGLWPIAGCTFGPDGTFYGSELIAGFGPTGPVGDVVAIPFAHPDQHAQLTGGALSFPGGVAVGPDGHVYVSNMSTSAAGQVVRLP